MGIKKGPSTTTDNLVFGFDTGFTTTRTVFDTYRFNNGGPTTNIADTDTKRTLVAHGTSQGNAATIADASSEKGPGWKKITVTTQGTNHRLAQFPYITQNNTTNTFSIEYDFNGLAHNTGSTTNNGYYWKLDGSNGNMGTNVTDTGYQKAMTYTNSSSQVMAIFLAHNTLNRASLSDTIYFKNYQIEAKDHATPFTSGTRSANGESLLQITGSQTLNLTNVTFDDTGHMEFDGSDDTIAIDTITLGNGNWTIEAVIEAHSYGYNILSNSSGGPVTNAFGVDNNRIHYRNYDGSWQPHNGSSTTVDLNRKYQLVWVNKAGPTNATGTMDMYVNGVKDSASGFNSFTTNGGPVNAIGRNWFNFFNGYIYIFRYYNRSLTDQEILNNFNSIQERFDI
tara:strand:+ start:3692 stop:4873 length:1182 start_codon:yes stop_codon:yes gene_type:complete